MGTVRAEPDDACPQIGSAKKTKQNKNKITIGGLPELTMLSQWEVTFEDESCKILIFDRETPPGTSPKNWPKMPQNGSFLTLWGPSLGHFTGRPGEGLPQIVQSPGGPIGTFLRHMGPGMSQFGEKPPGALCRLKSFPA